MTERAPSSFGDLLKQFRLEGGMTQEALAERAGIGARAVSDLERDPARAPRLDTVRLLSDALRLDDARRSQLLQAARQGPTREVVPADDLPYPLTPLIGRERDLEDLLALIRSGDARAVTMVGPGGVGKTRLAIEAARRLTGDFSGGVRFVDLAPLSDVQFVATVVAGRVGVAEGDETPQAALVRYLHSLSMLLVLDNFEHLLPAATLVANLASACPSLVVLVTSREPLHVRGERLYPVRPLETGTDPRAEGVSPAVRLFLERAMAAGCPIVHDPPSLAAASEIVSRLDGLPLAVELAAAWTRILPLPALLTQLEQRLPLLSAGARDLPARQRTMRDAIAWSYDLLDAGEQRFFRDLCVFAGGFTPGAAVHMWQFPADSLEALSALSSLRDKSLIGISRDVASEPPREIRLSMLETIREFGQEMLRRHEEFDAVSDRHAEYYRSLACQSDQALRAADAAEWLSSLDREHGNLRAALRWSIDRREADSAAEMAASLWRFWAIRGHLGEGRRWITEILSMGRDSGLSTRLELKLRIGCARLALDQGDVAPAVELNERLELLLPEEGDVELRGSVMNFQGLLARHLAHYGQAVRYHGEAVKLARETGNKHLEADALLGASFALGLISRGKSSIQRGREALDLYRRLGDPGGTAESLHRLALESMSAGDYARTELLFTEALEISRRLRDTGREAESLFTLGILATFRQQYEGASEHLGESLQLRRDRGDERGVRLCLHALALVELNRGNREHAVELIRESNLPGADLTDPWVAGMSSIVQGYAELVDRKWDDARDHFAGALEEFLSVSNLLYVPWCLDGLTAVAALTGEASWAARLVGARQTITSHSGSDLPPPHAKSHAEAIAAIHSVISPTTYDAMCQEGAQMPLREMIGKVLALPT